MNVPEATQRLTFREANEADAGFFLKLMNEPGYHRYIGDKQISDLARAAAYIREKLIQSYRSNGFGLWLVTRMSDGEPLGICGLVEREGFDGPDLGYAFLAEHGGSGFAREAAHAVSDHAERMLGLAQLIAIVT
ncbi:MAG: GNAT family N-acetyltransferase, partial [Roseibium sp.]